MHLRTVSPMSSDPRVPKNGTVSNSPFHFLEFFRQLVADFFETSSYDVGGTCLTKILVWCVEGQKWRWAYIVQTTKRRGTTPGEKALQIARGQWQSPCAVPRRSGLTSPETYHEEMASDKSSRAKVRETFSVNLKDLTLHTSVDFGWFYGQVIRVLMWLPIIQSLSQEQQAWEFQFRSVPGFSMHKWWRNFFGTQWPLKIQESYSLYIYVYLGHTGTPIYQPFAQALSHLIHPLQFPPQIQDGWLGNPPWM